MTTERRGEQSVEQRLAALRARQASALPRRPIAPPSLGELHTPRVLLMEIARHSRAKGPVFAVVSDMEEDTEAVRRTLHSLN